MIRYAYDAVYDIRTGEPWRITIAYNREPKLIEYAYTLCNPKDRFEKAIGRKIATEKLLDFPTALGFLEFVDDKTIVQPFYLHKVFTPEALENMNFMYFKHNAIAGILTEYAKKDIMLKHRIGSYLM